MKKYITIFISLLFSATYLSAKTITVTSDADSGAGTLREAITNAEANDTITFAGNVTTVTLTNYGFTLNKNITIIGNEENNTVITSNSRHFTLEEMAGITLCLNNLTLKDGYAITCGGAIFNRSANTLTLNNCVFVNNRTGSACGAVYNQGKLTINNCFFENNSTTNGVGAVLNGGEMYINNSTFINNKGTEGAIYSYSNTITSITDCIFKENKGEIASAFRNRGVATVVNSLFIFNEHFSTNLIYDRSGTISNYSGLESEREGMYLTIVNSTIADNSDEVGLYNGAQITLHNNIIWNNGTNDVYTSNNGTTTTSYNLIGTSNTDLSGNGNIIGENPLFVGDYDYSLQKESPAIDKGNNDYLPIETTKDLAGNPRISNGTVDMGAYEYQQQNVSVKNISNDGIKVYAYDRTIVVENATAPITVYNLVGSVVSSVRNTNTTVEIPVPQAGFYVVKTGETVKKVIVNY